MDENSNGTLSFKNDDFEEHKQGDLSLVKLKLNKQTECLGQYSVFAGNEKLTNEVGFDVTKAEFLPCVAPSQQTELYASDAKQLHALGGNANNQGMNSEPLEAEKTQVLAECVEVCSRKSCNGKEQIRDLMNGKEADTGEVQSEQLKAEDSTTRSCLMRSCSSVYRSCRKRKSEETKQDEFAQESAKKRCKTEQKQEKTVSRKRKRQEDIAAPFPETALHGERECKIKILSFNEYVAFRRCQMGLKSGLIVKKEEAIATDVIARDGNSYRIHFVRASFSDKEILRSTMFEKAVERKCRKYLYLYLYNT